MDKRFSINHGPRGPSEFDFDIDSFLSSHHQLEYVCESQSGVKYTRKNYLINCIEVYNCLFIPYICILKKATYLLIKVSSTQIFIITRYYGLNIEWNVIIVNMYIPVDSASSLHSRRVRPQDWGLRNHRFISRFRITMEDDGDADRDHERYNP